MSEDTSGAGGLLVLVVGPSGAGKDSLLRAAREALAGAPRLLFPRRWVTRRSDAHEDNRQISAADFRDWQDRGLFALSWDAHGNGYGIDRQIEGQLGEGCTVVCNVSRTVVEDARSRYARVLVVEVTARPEILAGRLQQRQREGAQAQARRLDRAAGAGIAIRADVVIDNSERLEAAVDQFLRILAQ